MSSRSKNDWKRNERGQAAALGCKRNARSLQAMSAGTLADSANDWLAVESKLRASLPKFLTDAVNQASKAAKPDQLPIAVFHARGTKRMDDLVVMRLSDFVDNFVGSFLTVGDFEDEAAT
ncbi:MAG: hypothetical protein QOH93_658 [Chloroflexia bacterium]|jgi:hypothetical protein|nr:hypothetical protein [Chloroflexia bacterium]